MSPDDHDDCHLNTSFNRLLIGSHGNTRLTCDHAGTSFSGRVDFTDASVLGVTGGGGSTAPLTTDDITLPNSPDTVTVKLGTIDTELTAATQNVTTLQLDHSTLDQAAVKTSGNQDVDGIKHFRDDTFRLAKNYRFVHDSATDEVAFQHFDGSSTVDVYTAKPTATSGATLQMDSRLKLQAGTGLELDSAGNTQIREDNGSIVLDGTSAGFQLSVNQATKFSVELDGSDYVALLDGSTLAKQEYITSAPIRQLFKESVIEGGLGDGSTLNTEFRNPISISEYRYQITNPDPIAWSVSTIPNTFTCNCDSEFTSNVAVTNNSSVVVQPGSAFLSQGKTYMYDSLECVGSNTSIVWKNSNNIDSVSYTYDTAVMVKEVALPTMFTTSSPAPLTITMASGYTGTDVALRVTKLGHYDKYELEGEFSVTGLASGTWTAKAFDLPPGMTPHKNYTFNVSSNLRTSMLIEVRTSGEVWFIEPSRGANTSTAYQVEMGLVTFYSPFILSNIP